MASPEPTPWTLQEIVTTGPVRERTAPDLAVTRGGAEGLGAAASDPAAAHGGGARALARVEEEIRQARSHGSSLCCLLLHLEGFRSLAALRGRGFAESLRRQALRRIRNNLRPVDLVARYGDERVLVVCRQVPVAGALRLGERLASLLAEQPFGRLFLPGVRVGCAFLDGAMPGAWELVEAAERALQPAVRERRWGIA